MLDSIAKDVANDPAAIRAFDGANLTQDGFVTELVQSQDGPGGQLTGTAGLTKLGSHAAAESYEKFTFALVAKPGPLGGPASEVRYARFKIPGVPSAEGAEEITRHKKVAHANMEWVEGDCMIQLGDGVASHTALTAPLITAAQDIYERTKVTAGKSGLSGCSSLTASLRLVAGLGRRRARSGHFGVALRSSGTYWPRS